MDFVLRIVSALFVLSFGQFLSVSNGQEERFHISMITVSNGQTWGSWGYRQSCPFRTFASGFSLKVERLVGNGDNTALNGIALRCTVLEAGNKLYSTVKSDVGSWGVWTQDIWCKKGVLNAFQLRVENYQENDDDTAANNIRFSCTSGEILTGDGMSWGEWGKWSPLCDGAGICGIQTRVEPMQFTGDDTALNDVRFYCCY